MGKRFSGKFSLFLALLLVFQLVFPMSQAFAAEPTATATATPSVTATDIMLPPSNLAAQLVSPEDVKLTWSAVFGATGYNVYGIFDGSLNLLGKVTTNSYTANDLPEGSYGFVVSTLNAEGESGPCAPVNVDVVYPDMVAPATFTAAVTNGTDVVLNWAASQYATSYNVYEVSADGQNTLLTTLPGRTYTVSNAAPGTNTFAVSAVNALFGESPVSTTANVDILPPTMLPPTSFTNTIANGNDVTLKWTSAPYATNYKIYQVLDGQNVLAKTVTGTTVTLTNQPAGDYTYEIHTSSDRYGESTDGTKLSFTLVHPTMAAPANLKSTLANYSDATLTWSSVPYATGYKIYQVIDGQSVLQKTVTTTSATFTTLADGDYNYEVRAYSDRFGESTSSTVTVTVEVPILLAPANFASKLQNGNDIVLTWDKVSNANTYKVYQIVNGQKVLKSTVTSTTVTYSNQPGGDYAYEIHSVSTRLGESTEGSSVSLALVTPVMQAPANLVQTIKNGTDFTLTWDAAPFATSYKIYQVVNGTQTLKYTATTTSQAFTNMQAGDYTYEVHSVSSRFGESTEGSLVTVTMNGQVMAPPTGLNQTINNGNDITLKWTAAPYATSYKVYQMINGQKVLKTTLSGTTVTYSNQPGGDYDYLVTSVSTTFGESPTSAELKFTLDIPVMAAPANPTSKVQNGNDVVLQWTAATYANSYKVYEELDGQEVLKISPTSTATTLSNVAAGEHTYVVHSFSTRYGESPEGSKVNISVVFPTMQTPGALTQTITNQNDVTLRWGTVPVPYATAYNVYQVIDGQKVLQKTVTTLSATFSKLPAGDYSYIVHSYSDRYGESTDGSAISFTLTLSSMVPPVKVTQTVANGNDTTLKWDASQNATAYKVYQVVDDQLVLKSTVTGLQVTYANQPVGDYTYEVHSFSDRLGESVDGTQVTYTMTFPTMQAPGTLTQTVANGNDVTLKWGTAQYATAYKLYQISNGEKTLLKTLTGTSTVYTNLPAGDYSYEVHSYSVRFGESPEGSSLNFTLVWPVVQPPVLTGNVYNENNITFTWPTVQWANEYRLYKLTGDTRQLVYKGTALTYQVYNLTEDTHSYVVTAYSTRFGESAASAPVTKTIVYPEMQAPTATVKVLSQTSAQISWGFVTYANNYNVYELVDGQPVQVVKNLNNLSTTLTNLPYKDHEYYVTSYSNSFGESKPSNIVLAKLIVDTQAPVTTNNAPTAWTNGSAVVTLSATDNITGVAKTLYSLNGSAFVEGTSINVTQEGINQISFYSVDKVGNTEATKTISVKIDKTAPVTASAQANGQVTLTATDAQSGVAKTYYSVNGADFVEGTTVSVTTEGVNKVTYYSVDVAGNKEQVQSTEVTIDKTAPVTTSNAPTIWSASDVNVILTATDNLTGVGKTYYSVNGADFVEGTTVTVTTEGINKIAFYSVDNAGNKEQTQTVEVKLDKAAPITASTQADGQVTLTATDAQSGVAKTYYSINGADFVEGATVSVTTEGVNKVSYYSVDVAGNKEQVQSTEVTIDKTAPVTTSNAPTIWTASDVNVILTATDNLTGVAKTYYSVNGADFVEGTTVTVTTEGINKIAFYSVDNAGNKEQTQTVEVKLDKAAPITKSNEVTAWAKSSTITLTTTDATSGVAKTYYSVNGSEFAEGTSFTVDTEGVNKVTFYSVDIAGNKELPQSLEVKVDHTAPTTNANDVSAWAKSATVTLTATDAQSGVVKTYYSINGAAYVEGTTFTVDAEGFNKVTFYTIDAAGNQEQPQTLSVNIDRTAPITTSSTENTSADGDTKVTLTAQDAVSGVAKTFYSIDGGVYVEGNSLLIPATKATTAAKINSLWKDLDDFLKDIEINRTQPSTGGDDSNTGNNTGLHKVSFYSTDVAGNVEAVKTVDVNVAPAITLDIQPMYRLGLPIFMRYKIADVTPKIVNTKLSISGPGGLSITLQNNGLLLTDKPGLYTMKVTATDANGKVTTYQKQFVVYIGADVDVTPSVIKGNKGEFTVRVDLPWNFSTQGFDLNTVTLNGVKALNTNNGYYNQAKNGQFKFERSSFNWTPGSEVKLEFRGYVNGNLVIGQTTVKVQK